MVINAIESQKILVHSTPFALRTRHRTEYQDHYLSIQSLQNHADADAVEAADAEVAEVGVEFDGSLSGVGPSLGTAPEEAAPPEDGVGVPADADVEDTEEEPLA